ncbi:unnamed protein product [Prunus armeniaca]
MMNDKIHKKELTLNDLQCEVHNVKEELRDLKNRVRVLELYLPFSEKDIEEKSEQLEFENLMEEFQEKIELVRKESLQEEQVNIMKFINSIDRVIAQKWDAMIIVVIDRTYTFTVEWLIDTGADLNCINEGVVPTRYFKKTTQVLHTAVNSQKMGIQFKLSNAVVLNQGICFETPFILVKGLNQSLILGTPFINMLYPFSVSEEGIRIEVEGQPIIFRFSQPPKHKYINEI